MSLLRLEPPKGRCWLDCAPADAPDGIRMLHAMLDAGLLEAWQDRRGLVRLRAPLRESVHSDRDAWPVSA